MKKDTLPPLDIKTISLALDASPYSIAALDEAVEVAYRLGAKLNAICVEDINMIRAASVPYAVTVSPYSIGAKMQPKLMDSLIKVQTKAAARALEYATKNKKVSCALTIKRGIIEKEVISEAGKSDILVLGWAGWQAADFYFSNHPATGQSRFNFPVSRIVKMGTSVRSIIKNVSVPTLILHGRISDACMLGVFFDKSRASEENLSYSLRIFDHLFSYCKKGKDFSGIEVFITDKSLGTKANNLLKLRPDIKSKVTVLMANDIHSSLLSHIKDKEINLLSLSKSSSLVTTDNLRIFDRVASSLLITV